MKSTVLNSRPREQAAELTRLLAKAGFEVVEAPAIATVSAWDPEVLHTVRSNLAARAYAWVVLPSQNAGRLLADDLRRAGASVVCGAASARALRLAPEFALDSFSASAALEVLRPVVQAGQRILVPRAAEGSPELMDALQALGAHVEAPIAYRTVAVEPSALGQAAARMRSGEIHALTACSSSALNSLLAAMGRESLSRPKLICLGATTAEAARQAALRVDGVARTTSMASLVDAVRATLPAPAVPA